MTSGKPDREAIAAVAAAIMNPDPIDSYLLPIVIGVEGSTKIRVRYPRCDLRGWF